MSKFFSKFKLPSFRLRSSVLAIFWTIIILSLMAFVDKRQSQKECKQIRINLDNEYKNHFVEEEDVNNLITDNEKISIIDERHEFLNLKELENRVLSHGFVEKVILSKDIKGAIDVKVTQYLPIARLSLPNGNDKYISSGGKILPVSNRYTTRVIVIGGPYNNKLVQKDWTDDSLRTPYFKFINKILSDDFLKVMVASVYVDRSGEINIYPQVGDQHIEYGYPINQDVKFAMLHAFYKKIIPAKGWHRYSNVSLKYQNQIICE